MAKSVVIVDDSGFMRSHLSQALKENDYDVLGTAENGEKAIDMILDLNPDIVTLDNILPDMTGIDVLKVIREQGVEAAVIMISAVGQQSVILEASTLGASEYVIKPFSDEQLLQAIGKL